VLEPHHLKLALRARPNAEATIGQRIDNYLSGAQTDGQIPFEPIVEELERALILRASYATKWNQSKTAEMLNLKRDKLRYRMKLYELQPDDGAPTTQD
jgi:DNA-binding NtrC family response regulator